MKQQQIAEAEEYEDEYYDEEIDGEEDVKE